MVSDDEIKRQHKRMNRLLVVGGVVLVAIVVLAVALFVQLQSQKKEDTHAISERIIKKVSQLYLLPRSETPTVAQIKDKSSLRGNEEFYTDAQDGDYILIYQKNRTAFLYRESINKLVKVSPVSMPPPSSESSR